MDSGDLQARPDGARKPRPKSKSTPRRSPLSRSEVVDTALRIIDEHGFYELTMRGLARRLGVFPAAVYWHAGTKAELLALVSERVLEEIDVPDESLDWREWMLELGVRARRVLGSHPRFASYFITNIQVSSQSLVLADATLGVLSRAGFRGQDLVDSYNALFGAAISWTAGEFAEETDAASDDPSTEREIERRLQEAGPDDLAHLREHWSTVANRVYGLRWNSGATRPMDSSFERMLRTLISGFASRLAAEPTPPDTDASNGSR